MEKRSTISKKTLKIILGICIGVTILAVAGLFVYTYLADHNTLGRKISIWGVDVPDWMQSRQKKRSLRNLQIVRYPFRKMIRKFTVLL